MSDLDIWVPQPKQNFLFPKLRDNDENREQKFQLKVPKLILKQKGGNLSLVLAQDSSRQNQHRYEVRQTTTDTRPLLKYSSKLFQSSSGTTEMHVLNNYDSREKVRPQRRKKLDITIGDQLDQEFQVMNQGLISFDKFMTNKSLNLTTRNKKTLNSMPLTYKASQIDIAQSICSHQERSSINASQTINNSSVSHSARHQEASTSTDHQRHQSLLIANSELIDQHLNRALSIHRSLQVPLKKIKQVIDSSEVTLGQSTEQQIPRISHLDSSPKLPHNQVTNRLHQASKTIEVNQIVEKRLNKKASPNNQSSDWITQTSLFKMFCNSSDGPNDRHSLTKSLTDRKRKKANQSNSIASIEPSQSELNKVEMSKDKKLKIAQILQAQVKIGLKAQRIQDESLLHDMEQLRKILHGCVRTGSNVAKDDIPLRQFFKSSGVYQRIEFIKRSTLVNAKKIKHKYEDLGELGDYYAQKERREAQERKVQTERCSVATRPKQSVRWTRDEVVAHMDLSKQEKQNMYMIQERGQFAPQIESNKEFIEKVNQYVSDLRNNLPPVERSRSPSPTFDSITEVALRRSLSKLEPQTPRARNLTPTSPTMAKFIKRLSTQTSFTLNALYERFGNQNKEFNMQLVTDYLVGKIGFQQLCKTVESNPSVMTELLNEEPRQKYFLECKSAIQPAIDVLNKVNEKQLCLEEYTLGQGQCKGFMKACLIDTELLTHLILDNCGLNDEQLSMIMIGLNQQKKIVRISLKRTEIGVQSVEQLGLLLQKVKPKQLEELRIEKCQISTEDLKTLLDSFCKDIQLRKLYLVGQDFHHQHIKLLSKFLKSSLYLTLIDLSWSRTIKTSILPLLSAIAENKRIQFVDISHNSLTKNSNYGGFGNMNEIIINEINLQKRNVLSLEGSQLTDKRDPKTSPSDLDKDISQLLKELIAQNKKLLHLDLSNLGLSAEVLIEVVDAVKKSQSLIGVHLSGNSGLTQEVYQTIMTALDATYEQPLPFSTFNQVLKRSGSNNHKSKRRNLTEALTIKQIQQDHKVAIHQSSRLSEIPQDRQLILTRVLGHNIEMRGAENWQISRRSSDCWICDKNIYTLFFWSPEIGRVDGSEIALNSAEKMKLAQYILQDRSTNEQRKVQRQTVPANLIKQTKRRLYNKAAGVFIDQSSSEDQESIYSDSNDDEDFVRDAKRRIQTDGPAIILPQERKNSKLHGKIVPMIYGQFNNWQAQPMIPITKLAELLEPNQFSIISEMKANGQLREEVQNPNQMDRREGQIYKKKLDEYLDKFQRTEVWTKAVQRLIVYNQPHCTALNLLKVAESKNIYIAAGFMKCGRQDYMVQYGAKFYFHETISSFRKEEIAFPKVTESIIGKKERNPNVFKHWTVDTPAIIKACISSDLVYWKLAHFVKDPGDQNEVSSIIQDNYAFLKDVFLTIACHSEYPSITAADFLTFAQESEMLNSQLTVGVLETQFIAARVETDYKSPKVPGQSILHINRFEFLECIVRIATCTYKQSGGSILTLGQAMTQLIEQIKEKFKLEPSQPFRQEFLWTREVNLTLDANKKAIKELYDHYSQSSKFKRINIKSAIQLMTKDTKIKLTEKDARACYGLCQQTCADIVTQGNFRLNHLDLIEFTELIGRVADRYFHEEELFLHTKIDYVLDEWLRIVDRYRQEPKYFAEVGVEDSQLED